MRKCRLGSVLIYTGSVFHGGGANKSNGDRAGINITYTLGLAPPGGKPVSLLPA